MFTSAQIEASLVFLSSLSLHAQFDGDNNLQITKKLTINSHASASILSSDDECPSNKRLMDFDHTSSEACHRSDLPFDPLVLR